MAERDPNARTPSGQPPGKRGIGRAIIGVIRLLLGALLLTAVILAGELALALMVIHSGHPLMPGLISLAGFSIGLVICIWLLRPGVRAFCAAQRRRRWGVWSLVWLAALGGAAPAVGVVGLMGGVIIWQVLEIRACRISIFPADSSYCQHWYGQWVAAEAQRGGGVMTRTPRGFAGFWPERWRQLTYGPPPTDLFGQLERLMRERHERLGWLDARDRHDVQAVVADWEMVFRLWNEEGLVAVAAHIEKP